jgi:hypothetical protein
VAEARLEVAVGKAGVRLDEVNRQVAISLEQLENNDVALARISVGRCASRARNVLVRSYSADGLARDVLVLKMTPPPQSLLRNFASHPPTDKEMAKWSQLSE